MTFVFDSPSIASVFFLVVTDISYGYKHILIRLMQIQRLEEKEQDLHVIKNNYIRICQLMLSDYGAKEIWIIYSQSV